MAIHGTTGFCSACQRDTVFERDRWSADDAPLLCSAGHDYAEFGGTHAMKRTEGTVHQHDPYTYTPKASGAWYRGRAGITTDEARAIQRRNKLRAEHSKRSKAGGRLKASIPAALFFAQKKMHGIGYWMDKKNVERVTKDWAVHEDRK